MSTRQTDAGWFDSTTGLLNLDERVMSLSSYQKIMKDGVVTNEEIMEQGVRVADLLRRLEGMLSDKAHAVAMESLCELAVLYAIERQHEIQSISKRRHL